MADNDPVDTIAQYDMDEDFPEYANEQNKELNQIVSSYALPPIILKLLATGERKSQVGPSTGA